MSTVTIVEQAPTVETAPAKKAPKKSPKKSAKKSTKLAVKKKSMKPAKKAAQSKAAKKAPAKKKAASKAKPAKAEKPTTGQSGPAIEGLAYEMLNPKAMKIVDELVKKGPQTIGTLAEMFKSRGVAKANSTVRNSLRRLVCGGFVEKVDRGEYKVTVGGRRKQKAA